MWGSGVTALPRAVGEGGWRSWPAVGGVTGEVVCVRVCPRVCMCVRVCVESTAWGREPAEEARSLRAGAGLPPRRCPGRRRAGSGGGRPARELAG